MRLVLVHLAALLLGGCRVLTAGLEGTATPRPALDGGTPDGGGGIGIDAMTAVIDASEPPGSPGAPLVVGCSDGTREGFRDLGRWPTIAGCAGAFDRPGVLGNLTPVCSLQAGDTSTNPLGLGCNAADLCAEHWHLCRGAADVAAHSATGCESCVPAGEPRLFIVGAGASSMGICSPDAQAANDLHGCGGYGQPESDTCAPLVRRLGFADCAQSHAWSCGGQGDSLREAAVVTKHEIAEGGALCCRD